MSRADGRPGPGRGDLVRIFLGDSVAGLGDGALLGRFVEHGDEAAFEGLVGRLGPMVLGVCRRILADPHDVDDAFQATFLVLVRRAGSIHDRDLVGPWLHGVATRTALRARAKSRLQARRDRVAVVPEAREDDAPRSEWPELRALIDEEIDRLPEHHRRPVVLCDVEGLSREEAAARLGWTLNMVRGRLERARDRLRGRLSRRGLTPFGARMTLMVNPATPSVALIKSTAHAAIGFAAGRTGTVLASASAVALSRGVLRMMMLSKLKLGLAVVISAGFVGAGSSLIVAQGPGALPKGAAPAELAKIPDDAPVIDKLTTLGRSRVERARERLKTQRAFYEEGRITIDRILDASEILMNAELDVSRKPEERKAAILAHLETTKDIEKREKDELEVGRATTADVLEAQTRLLEAEYLLAQENAGLGTGATADLNRRLTDLEKKVDRILELLNPAKR